MIGQNKLLRAIIGWSNTMMCWEIVIFTTVLCLLVSFDIRVLPEMGNWGGENWNWLNFSQEVREGKIQHSSHNPSEISLINKYWPKLFHVFNWHDESNWMDTLKQQFTETDAKPQLLSWCWVSLSRVNSHSINQSSLMTMSSCRSYIHLGICWINLNLNDLFPLMPWMDHGGRGKELDKLLGRGWYF